MGKRRRHTEEFKREAVRLMETRGERTITEVAESLGIAENMLHSWRKTYSDTTEAIRKERGETPDDELKRLRREVAQLKRDKEILKQKRIEHGS
jgi:transposase